MSVYFLQFMIVTVLLIFQQFPDGKLLFLECAELLNLVEFEVLNLLFQKGDDFTELEGVEFLFE